MEPEHLKPYSLEQVAEGIWFLIGGSSPSSSSQALLEPAISLYERIDCIYAMFEFFRAFVVPATSGLADTNSDPFHIACFMWFDILPLRPFPGDPLKGEPELHHACVKAMTQILGLPSDVCRITALHGLNHWQEHYPKEVASVVGAFLANSHGITSRIREYAEGARDGLRQ